MSSELQKLDSKNFKIEFFNSDKEIYITSQEYTQLKAILNNVKFVEIGNDLIAVSSIRSITRLPDMKWGKMRTIKGEIEA